MSLKEAQQKFFHLFTNPESATGRLKVYQNLVINNQKIVIEAAADYFYECLEPTQLEKLIFGFLAQKQNQTPYYGFIPRQFCRFVQSSNDDFLNDFLKELLDYQTFLFDLRHASFELSNEQKKAALPLNPSLRLIKYSYPFDQIVADKIPFKKAKSQKTFFAQFRDLQNHQVQVVRLNELSFWVLKQMQKNPAIDYVLLLDSLNQKNLIKEAITENQLIDLFKKMLGLKIIIDKGEFL